MLIKSFVVVWPLTFGKKNVSCSLVRNPINSVPLMYKIIKCNRENGCHFHNDNCVIDDSQHSKA